MKVSAVSAISNNLSMPLSTICHPCSYNIYLCLKYCGRINDLHVQDDI